MTASNAPGIAPILVIGYGSNLRGDDSIGRDVAGVVSEWDAPHVKAIAVHQLTPELSEPVSAAHAVIFVDADVTEGVDSVQIQPIGPKDVQSPLLHAAGPRGLLALTEALYERTPEAWLLTIPVEATELGQPASAAAKRGAEAALCVIRDFVAERYGKMPVAENVSQEESRA